MAKSFTPAEWKKIHKLMDDDSEQFGFPERRRGSVLLASFNIRKLAGVDKRSAGSWEMLRRICESFDLIAIQEVQDDLAGLRKLKNDLGKNFGMVASDITGATPGSTSPTERLAFLFNWKRVQRTEVASDITYDRSSVVGTIFGGRKEFWARFGQYAGAMSDWEKDKAKRKKQGKKPKAKPVVHLPKFVTFIRQPLCVSFRIAGSGNADPYDVLAVNAHLLYGKYKDERWFEFEALVGWLIERAKSASRMYHPNIIMLGDCNLDFKKTDKRRTEIETVLKKINGEELAGKKHAKLNFPFLTPYPETNEIFRSNARLSQTYDQIGLVVHDPRLPDHNQNKRAGKTKNGFDYGVFNFVDLFAQAVYGKKHADLTSGQRKSFYGKFEHDVSDHMPIWIRLPRPKAS
jgi:endonuclease/exonuclease/phosphatase family metal-dependent hydrolase